MHKAKGTHRIIMAFARRRFTYANVGVTAALVFAMGGGAFAATHSGHNAKHKYVISSTKQISPPVLKQLKGKAGSQGKTGEPGKGGEPGKAGASGAAGTAGQSVTVAAVGAGNANCAFGGSSFTGLGGPAFACNGKEGAKGVPGESVAMKAASAGECKEGGVAFTISGKTEAACNGKVGTPGSPGVNGESVTNTALAAKNGSGHCEEGGAELKVGSGGATYACNGSPWTAGGTLPSGQEEKGSWSVTGGAEASVAIEELLPAPISFTIPLASAPAPHFINTNNMEVIWNKTTEKQEEVTSTECKGTAAGPSAESGNLCVYAGTQNNARPGEFGFAFENPSKGIGTEGEVATDTGAMLTMETEKAATFTIAWGTWAVKAA